jgi:hypothetical protein
MYYQHARIIIIPCEKLTVPISSTTAADRLKCVTQGVDKPSDDLRPSAAMNLRNATIH